MTVLPVIFNDASRSETSYLLLGYCRPDSREHYLMFEESPGSGGPTAR